MKHNRELGAYQKIVLGFFELNNVTNPNAIPIKAAVLLKNINKYWTKYHAKEFRIK